ncbi:hypothetical protein L218DRAFT_935665 [Marasmius fiardii PR-910]|nr:hypothetical protein L218DRAFT_935665 [Marasmius fiardii PR-910]
MSASRRSSTSSIDSFSSAQSLVGPESRLILVHDNADEDDNGFSFEDSDEDGFDPQFNHSGRTSTPLSPSLVFLYLLSPHMKLGSLLLPNVDLSLKFGLPALFLFAILSAFTRQIWFMLARYVRRDDLTDVVVEVFIRGRGKNKRRKMLKTVVQLGSGLLRILLSIIYIRVSIGQLTPLLSGELPITSSGVLSVIVGFFLIPFCITRSLSSKMVVYATWGSIVTFILWFFCVTYAYAHGTLEVNKAWLRMGALWQGITTIAFAFASSNTLALHASLRTGIQPSSSPVQKRPLSHSFKFLSILSVSIALLFSIPLVVFAAIPNQLQVDNPAFRIQPFIAFLDATTLLLGIPSILVTVPKFPVPEQIRWRTSVPIYRLAVFCVVLVLANVPAAVNVVLSDILIASALSATYFLPALLHIINHFFRRPLAIIIPSQPGTPNTSSPVDRHSSVNDPLLQRKEQALQKKQWKKRIVWDLGVWTLLLPIGGGGFAWAIGTLTGRW